MVHQDKYCPRCDTMLPVIAFHVARNRKSGRSSWCKACTKEQIKKTRLAQGKKVHKKGQHHLRCSECQALQVCYTRIKVKAAVICEVGFTPSKGQISEALETACTPDA